MHNYFRKDISFALFKVGCQSTIRQGRRERPHKSMMGRPGVAFLPRASRLNRKRAFPRLYYFDAYHEQPLRQLTTKIGGSVTESTDASRTTEIEGSDTEWHSTNATVSRLPPAAEADEDLADFKFGDGPIAGAAAVAGQDESHCLHC